MIFVVFISTLNAICWQLVVDDDHSKEWGLYDAGPKTIKCPLMCFPPASGTADIFYRQLLGLSAKGFRIIAVSFHIKYNSMWVKIQKKCEKTL